MKEEKTEILNGADGCPPSGVDTEAQDAPACCCETAADGATECRTERRTERSEEAKKKLIHRLNRIEGQIRGIRQMIENDAYCNDVLTQSAAAGAALNAFNRELLACHIRGCVKRDLLAGDESVVDELVETVQKLMK